MNEVFLAELYNGKGQCCKLSLPATDYELLDALEQLHMECGAVPPKWDIIEHAGFEHLNVYLDECSIYELNALSRRLGSMDRGQLAAFEGLFQMALKTREGPMSVTDLLTYANSADCCHVVNVAINDATLGKFYAENGFIPELEDIPDSVFDKLDFAKIGREVRESEKGVFTKYGYVVQNEKLRPIAEPVYTLPQIPGYAFRLRIGRYPFDTDEQPEKEVHLELPTTEDRIARALEECGAANWAEVIYEVEDSAIPGQEEYTEYEDIVELNEFAGIIKRLEAEGQLTKLKAVLHATNCADVTSAISIAEALDLYDYDPDKRTAKEVALADLRRKIAEPTLTQLLSYVFLEEYGLDLMVSENAMVTPYGLVEFGDEEMILGSEESHKQDGMVMQ